MYDKTVRRRRAVLGLLVACALILLTAYFGESAGGGLHAVQRGVVEVVSPIQEGASRALKPVRDLVGWVGDTIDAKGEVKQLRAERNALRERAVTGAAAARENDQLRGLLSLDKARGLQDEQPVAARVIGQQTAEEVKLEIGSAYPMEEEVQAEIRGRDMVSGLPKTVVLTSEEIRQALEEPLSQIIDAVKETLDRTPPELASDIMDRGIMLAGGGSLLQGLDERLREETQMPAHLAESPLTCVAVGSGRSLEEFEVIHRTNKNSRNRRRRY